MNEGAMDKHVNRAARRRVTMEDVGRMAGVSQVTVSRALSDPSKVSAATLRKIHEAVELTGFVRNAVAGALASRRTGLIGAVVPSITNVTYSSMIRALSEGLRPAGYEILMSETGFDEPREDEAILTHLSRQPDVILLTGVHHSATSRRRLLGAGIPVVELWDVTDQPIDQCVGFDHGDAGRAAAAFARGRGYDRAATVTASDVRAARRSRAFAERFAEGRPGLPVPDLNVGGPASIEAGRRGLARLLDGDGPGQGRALHAGLIYCSSDILAHGVLIEAASRGLSVPGDLAVLGFGDQDFARHLEPALSTVRIDLDRLGRLAADTILSRMDGQPVERAVFDIGHELIARAST